MSNNREQFSVAVLDDYQNVALSMADWSALKGRAAVTVFNDHIADVDAVVSRLLPFDIVCVMRERTPMTRAVIERLPKLRLIASTALRNASIDVNAAKERGIQVVHTGYTSAPTIELTWALILAGARHLATGDLFSGIAARNRCNKDRSLGHQLRRRPCLGARRNRPPVQGCHHQRVRARTAPRTARCRRGP